MGAPSCLVKSLIMAISVFNSFLIWLTESFIETPISCPIFNGLGIFLFFFQLPLL